jgi:putative endonuclease
MSNDATGRAAEARAIAYLEANGYRIIAQRYRTRYGEIDIIAQRAEVLHFIEVKQRATLEQALYAITPKQLARIWQAAEAFMAAHPAYQQSAAQLDAICIAGSQLQHEQNIIQTM